MDDRPSNPNLDKIYSKLKISLANLSFCKILSVSSIKCGRKHKLKVGGGFKKMQEKTFQPAFVGCAL